MECIFPIALAECLKLSDERIRQPEALPMLSDPSYKTHDRASMIHWTKSLAHIRPPVKV